jgi:hypothetical protein
MRERRLRRAGLLVGLATAAACSTGNLTYSEVVRDLDAIMRPVGSGDDRRLDYLRNVQQAPGCARWLLLQPIKPLLLLIVGSTSSVELENPSGQVRDLAAELAPKAGGSLERGAATVLRLSRIAELDPSALNRIVALDGLWEIAQVHGLDVFHGLEQGEPAPGDPAQLERWRAVARTSIPEARAPVGAPLAPEAAAAYREAMAGLTAQPLRSAENRLWLVDWLGTAHAAERDPELTEATAVALRRAMQHAVQWTVARALQPERGADPARQRAPVWIEVRMRALEILLQAGGPDGVPLLLALMPDVTGPGVGPHDADLWLQLRLIHVCGQLDKDRALRKVRLAGPVAQAPIDFLARIALDDSFLLPSRLPALEAMALVLRREHLALEGEGEGSEGEWVRKWYDEYRRSS